MSYRIQNSQKLGTTQTRRDALAIAEAGLAAIDTSAVIRREVVVDGETLRIAGQEFDLTEYANIYIIGFGKVVCAAATALESVLRARVRDGAVIGVTDGVCEVVDTYAGTHPRQSHFNYTATKHIEEIARRAGEDDLVLVVVSGGGSALLCSSMSECDAGSRLYDAFTASGGTIEELNIVRKHISGLKGGGLARVLHPATVVGLIFSDIPGGDLAAVASGPTCYDESTIADAEAIISRYNLGEYPLVETPKDRTYFERVTNIPLVTNETALGAMADVASARGYTATVVSSDAYLSPEEVIETLGVASASAGSVQLLGGETILTIPETCNGTGGRNDYLALALLEHIRDEQVFLSIASDGRDNTDAAGALIDASIKERARELGLHADEHKVCMDSFPFMDALGAHIYTGPLASNVSDLSLLLTPSSNNSDYDT